MISFTRLHVTSGHSSILLLTWYLLYTVHRTSFLSLLLETTLSSTSIPTTILCTMYSVQLQLLSLKFYATFTSRLLHPYLPYNSLWYSKLLFLLICLPNFDTQKRLLLPSCYFETSSSLYSVNFNFPLWQLSRDIWITSSSTSVLYYFTPYNFNLLLSYFLFSTTWNLLILHYVTLKYYFKFVTLSLH